MSCEIEKFSIALKDIFFHLFFLKPLKFKIYSNKSKKRLKKYNKFE